MRQPSIVPADQTVNRTSVSCSSSTPAHSMRGAAIDECHGRGPRLPGTQPGLPGARAGDVQPGRPCRRATDDRSQGDCRFAGHAAPPGGEDAPVGCAGRAIDVLRQQKITAGSIVLLTDGRDIGSKLTPDQVVSKARSAGVRVFTVGLRSSQFSPEDLQSVARETNGAYAEAASTGRAEGDLQRPFGAACRRVHRCAIAPTSAPDVRSGRGHCERRPGARPGSYVTRRSRTRLRRSTARSSIGSSRRRCPRRSWRSSPRRSRGSR